jgi:hypothetical protein
VSLGSPLGSPGGLSQGGPSTMHATRFTQGCSDQPRSCRGDDERDHGLHGHSTMAEADPYTRAAEQRGLQMLCSWRATALRA